MPRDKKVKDTRTPAEVESECAERAAEVASKAFENLTPDVPDDD